jgi:hypothetical protein
MAVVTYNYGADLILEKAMNAASALSLRCAFVTSTTGATDIANIINPDLDFVATIDALANIGISTERITLTGLTSTEDDANNRANWDSADIVFAAAAGVTAWGAIIYDEGGGADASRGLIWGMSFASGQPVDGGLTLTVTDFARLQTATA